MKPGWLAPILFLGSVTIAQAQDSQDLSVSGEIRAGRKALEEEHPEKARELFALVLQHDEATNADRFVALVGLGKSDLWLGDYVSATDDFRKAQVLAHGADDQQAADTGLARALNAREYYRQAYALAAPFAPGQLQPTVEILRADLALGWEDRSSPFLQAAPDAGPDDHLGAEYLRLKSDIDFRLSDRVDGAFFYSHDSDNLTVLGFGAGAWLPGAVGGNDFNAWRMVAKTWSVADGHVSDRVNSVGAGTSMRLGDEQHINVSLGAANVGGWSFFQGGIDWDYRSSDTLDFNASIDRSPILTTAALADRVLISTYTLGAGWRPTDHLYILPMYFHQDFSEGNHRDGVAARLVLSPYDLADTPSALGAEIYARQYHSSLPSTGVYFNPANYGQVQLDLIGVHRLNNDWTMRVRAGFGYQAIDGAGAGSYDLELSVSGRLPGNGRLDAKLDRNSFASIAGGGSGYWCNTFTLSIAYPIGL